MEKETLFRKIKSSNDPLSKFREGENITACLYPEPYQGKDDVVCWFYSRNNHCQVFFACSQEVWNVMSEESWADVSYEFTIYVEDKLMPFCVENTDWERCERDGIDYSETTPSGDSGCDGCSCPCEPFGGGDFTYGIAEEDEFTLYKKQSDG